MKFPEAIPVYGDLNFRGNCPKESVEQASFFNKLRGEFPETYGLIALHPRNEGQLINGQFSAMIKHRAEGMAQGASDIVIPGAPSFVCELKRRDHTKSSWQDGQIEYIGACKIAGSFVCVALGAAEAWNAFMEWHSQQ